MKQSRAQFLRDLRGHAHTLQGMIALTLDSNLDAEQREHLLAARAATEAMIQLVDQLVPTVRATTTPRPRALVMDRDPAQRRALRKLLNRWGYTVSVAANDQIAMRALADPAHAFQLALLEHHPPALDALSVAQWIADAYIPREKIVMLLRAEHLGDLARFRALGIAHHLTQPIDANTFAALMRALTPAAREQSPLRVLLAEDNHSAQIIARAALERLGHSVAIANNGVAALQLFGRDAFDAILMDVEMPEQDGIATTRAIRAIEKQTGTHIPILAVTSSATPADRARCLDAGMDGFVAKPITPDALGDALAQLHIAPPVDLQIALDVSGDEALLREAVAVFLAEDYPRQMNDLRDALARGDALATKRAAHGLKGALASFGGNVARDLAWQLETLGRENNLRDAPRVFAEFENQVARFAEWYTKFNTGL